MQRGVRRIAQPLAERDHDLEFGILRRDREQRGLAQCTGLQRWAEVRTLYASQACSQIHQVLERAAYDLGTRRAQGVAAAVQAMDQCANRVSAGQELSRRGTAAFPVAPVIRMVGFVIVIGPRCGAPGG